MKELFNIFLLFFLLLLLLLLLVGGGWGGRLKMRWKILTLLSYL